MRSKVSSETFLACTLILFFLSLAIRASAQSVGDESATKSQQPASTTDAKPAATTEAGKVIQAKSWTLEGGKVWVDTGIGLEPGQRIAVNSEGSLRYKDAKADNGPDGLTRGFKDLIRILPDNVVGRPQEYGWAHAESITLVASRNHLRVWKAPFTVNGQMLWVGAATHDIGFEQDKRNNGLTHKID